MLKKSDLIIALSNISNEDKDSVGEKAASLGEVLKHGFPCPPGFVITHNAYQQFLKKNKLPDRLITEIFRAYKRLERPLKDANVEIIISGPLSQKKEVIKVHGEAVLIEKIKSIWTYSSSPIIVRKIPLTSCSGVMYTIDPKHNDKTKIVVIEDKTKNHYEVLKENLKITFKAIGHGKTKKLTDKQIVSIAALGKKLQEYLYFPQEIRFAIEKNKIFITQTKPITPMTPAFTPIKLGQAPNVQNKINSKKVLLKGKPLYSGIATGHLRTIHNSHEIEKVLRGEIIVIPYQDLIRHPVLKAGAIIATNNKFRYLAHPTLGPFFSGKPTIISTSDVSKILRDGTVVTVNGKNGEIYMGSKWQ